MQNIDKIINAIKNERCVFLSGPAGSGKSYTLNKAVAEFDKHRIKYQYTAMTGTASTIIENATTLHRALGIGLAKDMYDFVKVRKSSQFKKRGVKLIQSINVLIIDEMSMIRSDLLDLINHLCKYAKSVLEDDEAERIRTYEKPFGGLSIVFCGDLFQIGPIVKNEEKKSDHLKNGPWVFNSNVWLEMHKNSMIEYVYLREVKRTGDQKFIDALNRIRVGMTDDYLIKYFRDTMRHEPKNPVYLVATNNEADKINENRLKAIDEEVEVYEADFDGEPEDISNLAREVLAPEKLYLKYGARVMILKNDSDDMYVNGTIGNYIGKCKTIKMTMEDDVMIPKQVDGLQIELDNGDIVEVPINTWERKKSEIIEVIDEETMKVEKVRKEYVVASMIQFPVKLSWAISIHKCQGASLDSVVIDSSKFFAEGQAYVALSRCRSYENLKVMNFNRTRIKVSADVYNFYMNLHNEGRI